MSAKAEDVIGGKPRPFTGPEHLESLRQAVPPEHTWLGLERYWRKRDERDTV